MTLTQRRCPYCDGQNIVELTSRTLFSGSMMVFEEYSLAKRGMVL